MQCTCVALTLFRNATIIHIYIHIYLLGKYLILPLQGRCTSMPRKQEEVVDIFRKEKFEFFALTETKMKENGDVSWFKRLRGIGKVSPF